MTFNRRLLIQTVLAGVIVITACAYNNVDVPVVAPENAVLSLAGEWTGRYSGSAGSGSIAFRFEAGDNVAFAHVLMIPGEPERWDVAGERMRTMRSVSSLRTIVFVGDEAGRMSGTLDPYTDPQCDCAVITEFFGRRTSENELSGTFITRVIGTAIIQSGRWTAGRQDRIR